jgi:hypothetical protein
MYYHFAILLLFRPLIKLRIIGSSISPRDVCSQAADAICGLLRSYAQLYTLRRTPSFVPYFVLTSSIVHLAIAATYMENPKANETSDPPPNSSESSRKPPKLPPHATETLSCGIAFLTEMTPCHHFAQQALNILRYLAKKWNIEVDIETTAGEMPPLQEGVPPHLNQDTRPVTSSLNFFAPNFLESDFNCTWGGGDGDIAPGVGGGGGGGEDTKAGPKPTDPTQVVDPMENPLFWPFPMQGRPMLPTGKELGEAGFELV